MLGLIKNVILKFIPKWYFMNTYSQGGEDVIAWYFFQAHGIKNPSYLDIGTNNPIYGNNTFLFYKRGCTGVCVEADPELFGEILRVRKKDICINAGVTFDERKSAEFFIFTESALNTLSKDEAELRIKAKDISLKKTINIPLVNINNIIIKNFKQKPNFMSIDIEGIDFEILKAIDFSLYRPELICVESITFSDNNLEEKMNYITVFMKSKDYVVYADTHINTIFVDKIFFPTYI